VKVEAAVHVDVDVNVDMDVYASEQCHRWLMVRDIASVYVVVGCSAIDWAALWMVMLAMHLYICILVSGCVCLRSRKHAFLLV
jgi:hypothetical protein